MIYVFLAIAYMAGIYWASAIPGSEVGALNPFAIPDYVLHALEFSGLALLWFLALTKMWNVGKRKAQWLAVGIAAAYGLLDEFHQSFVPGRDPSLGDWAADVIGAALAVILAKGALGRRGVKLADRVD